MTRLDPKWRRKCVALALLTLSVVAPLPGCDIMSKTAVSLLARTPDFDMMATYNGAGILVTALNHGMFLDDDFERWEFYRLVGGDDPYGDFELIGETTNPAESQFVDMNVLPGETYHYRAVIFAGGVVKARSEGVSEKVPGFHSDGHVCDSFCGSKHPQGCQCDAECSFYGDCCSQDGTSNSNACDGSTCEECQ